ncbi:MAG: S9 family peptidase [Gammaproteobacteria bacterium]|nr:S9 family peptidase [Gammaproteobacteria bacterium]MYF37299.1 S9 family peptidase [Gammaproteobacteria bacterium]
MSLPFTLQSHAHENVVVRNVPTIDEEVLESIERYRNVRTASIVDWLGDSLLIRTRFGESSQLHRVRAPMGMREQITFADEPVSGVVVPDLKDVQSFLYLQDVGGTESYQIYEYDVESGKQTMISSGDGRYTGVSYSPDSSKISYTSTKRTGQYSDLYIFDLENNVETPLHIVDEVGWSFVAWHPSEEKALIRKYISVGESHLFEIDCNSGTKKRLLEDYGEISIGGVEYLTDGTVILISDHGSDFRRLHRINPETSELEVLVQFKESDVSSYSLSWDRSKMVVAQNFQGYRLFHLYDVNTGSLSQLLPDFSDGLLGGARFNAEGTSLAFTFQSARVQNDVYVLDLATNDVVRWTQSELGGIDADSLVRAELVSYSSFDDLEIPAFIYKPKTDGPHPVLIYIHGGPASQYRPGFSSRFQYYVNELGIAVVAPNVRGSSGYGKEYLTLDDWKKREDSVRDIGALLDWIEAQPDLDAERVIVDGGSYGGYMVLACLVHYSDRLLGGSERVGISNFVTFLENTQGYRRDLRRVEYGDERIPEMREFLESIAPMNHIEKIRKPLLIFQGFNDPRVPVSESEQITLALEHAEIPAWYVLYMDEGHGFRKKVNQDHSFSVQIQFLRSLLDESIATPDL